MFIRFESAILPREEGKLTSDPILKKHKKLKGVNTAMPYVSKRFLDKYRSMFTVFSLWFLEIILMDKCITFTKVFFFFT